MLEQSFNRNILQGQF